MLRHVRASVQMAAARPAISLGLRAATATVPALVFGQLTGRPGLLWMSLGGWLGTLADPGGPYPLRAAAMAGYLVFGALVTMAGAAAHGAWSSVIVLFVVGALASLVRAFGDAAATVGAIVLITLCIAIGSPGGAALERGMLIAAGSLFASVLALALWPVHPYRPARNAVADCYLKLALLMELLARLPTGSATEREAAAAQLARIGPPRVRAALETARAALAAVRRGRAADTHRGEQLLVLFESADLTLGYLTSAVDALAAAPAIDATFLLPLAGTFREIAQATLGRGEGPPPPPHLEEPAGHAEIHTLIEPIVVTATFAAEMADALRTGKEHPTTSHGPLPDAPARVPLRDQLALHSPLVRHAARMGFAVATAGALGQALQVRRSVWMTVTVVIILQPDLGSTVRRALDRVAGTVLGAISAALVAPLVHRPFIFGALLFPLSALAVALRPINYGLYSAFVTLVFLLISESSSGDWHLAGVRIATTLLGGGVALLFAFLFWPTREAERISAQIVALLSSLRDYIAAARQGPVAERAARRRFGLAAAAADASLSRLLGEPGVPEARIESMMAVLTYARRLRASLGALFTAGHHPSDAADLAARVDAALGRLLQAFLEQRAAATAPAWPTPQHPRLAALAARVVRQLEILRSALQRL
ncbi:MAG: hypothetical protein E6J85_14545 [Deltaproteobacteria bacterium]|nr:MAG: hypothetical protein E6J85_14545 [Deltaproteobacteria bacterium]